MGPSRKAARLALALTLPALLLASGCRTFGRGGDGERSRPFSKVRPPVAFEMLRDNPGLPIIDLRSRFEFTGPVGHVKGARSIPLDDLPKRLPALSPLKGRTFLVYCGHDDCGEDGLEILAAAGFDEAILMDGGIDAWVMDGFGTVTGPPPPIDFGAPESEEIAVE
jgi:rhodanese-related sulfurtransferase